MLSVALATYNEESNLNRCLTSIRGLADEIVVVDGSSTDRTLDIAASFGARVFKVKNLPMFHANKQLAVDKARGDWILQLDADEVVTPALRREIETVINKNDYVAYYLPRKNFFLGHFLKKGGQYPDYLIRLFKKGAAYFPQQSVHEQLKVEGPVGYLKQPLLHFTAPNFSRYLTNVNRYTSLTATQMKRQRLPLSSLNLLKFCGLKPVITFFTLFWRHKGFVDGIPGFIFALFSGLHWPIAYLKYWEANENRH
jgi:glycosyltransferase involved in cell wall biosynthesis